jgi:hypothetical protein
MRLFAAFAATAALGACATVTKGTTDTVNFISTPPGATVTVEAAGQATESCVAPCALDLNRKNTWQVEMELSGHTTATATLVPQVSGDGVAGMAGNVILGGFIGAGVDAATGAMNDLKPNPLSLVLAPNRSATAEAGPAPMATPVS